MTNKKYFAVDVSNDIHIVELHETLEQAKQSCVEHAVEAYDFANDMDDFETYTGHDLPLAVYGVILGRVISTIRPLNSEEKASGYYDDGDEIINQPEIVELNGWISTKERMPIVYEPVLIFWKTESEKERQDVAWWSSKYQFWVAIDFASPLNITISPNQVTHWQPLPKKPEF